VNARTLVTLFKTAAIAEAFSWAGLLIGMFFKRVLDAGELGVQIFGPIHGALFLLYLVSVLLVRQPLNLGLRSTIVALLASIPPFATVWVERRLLRAAAAEAPRESEPAGV
jgi:integral membrane protein